MRFMRPENKMKKTQKNVDGGTQMTPMSPEKLQEMIKRGKLSIERLEINALSATISRPNWGLF